MALPEDLQDPRLYRLPLDTRAVFGWVCLFSLSSSKIPGRFISQAYDAPMTLEDIAEGIHADTGTVEKAFGQLRATKPEPLLVFARGEWSIPDYERRSVDGEVAKIRAANRTRQATKRQRDRGGSPDDKKPLPLRREEAGT